MEGLLRLVLDRHLGQQGVATEGQGREDAVEDADCLCLQPIARILEPLAVLLQPLRRAVELQRLLVDRLRLALVRTSIVRQDFWSCLSIGATW